MDKKIIKFYKKFQYEINMNPLIYSEEEFKEVMQKEIKRNFSNELVDWLTENDYITFKYVDKNDLLKFYPRIITNKVIGEIEFEIIEKPRKYKREIVIEKK
jgi:serine/threonine protein kinase